MKKVFFYLLITLLMQLSNLIFGAIPAEKYSPVPALSNSINEVRNCLSNFAPDSKNSRDQSGIVSVTPNVLTGLVSSITSNSAVCEGNITFNGGVAVTARGICWSTEVDPTIIDSKTTNGTGIGNFSGNITGLKSNTTYYVRAYATNSKGTGYGSSVSFTTLGIPKISLNRTALTYGAITSGNNPDLQWININNSGTGTLNWNATSDSQWLAVNRSSGTGEALLSVSVNTTGLTTGPHTGTITFSDQNASNSPQTVTVTLNIYDQGKTSAPFGDFATPTNGSTVMSSIPVTGWVLDDIGIANVKIYNGNTYIGDAVLVEGARPDVETTYPGYPNNYKAGWGYMMLTNCLPNGGNGSYTIIAKATDMEGKEVILGSKTVTMDNAHCTLPFGAIDTPTQGGTISGNNFVNFGWVLTPLPNKIRTNGSMIYVIIDGVIQGNAYYNAPREDVAGLFPGLNNSNGAGGYFYLDTRPFKNGLHTIAWSVTDNNGNRDGIGSRYFSIFNANPDLDAQTSTATTASNHSNFNQANIIVDESEGECIEIKELERLEIRFSELPNAPTHDLNGYLVVGNQLRDCPVGSTLDKNNGIFYWQTGPGFIGKYRFIFTGQDENGQNVQKNIVIHIKPKY